MSNLRLATPLRSVFNIMKHCLDMPICKLKLECVCLNACASCSGNAACQLVRYTDVTASERVQLCRLIAPLVLHGFLHP